MLLLKRMLGIIVLPFVPLVVLLDKSVAMLFGVKVDNWGRTWQAWKSIYWLGE